MACVAGATVFLVLQHASVEPEELRWQSSREPGPKTTRDVPQACPWDDTSVAWKAHSPTCATFIDEGVEVTAQQLSLWWHWGFKLSSAWAWPTVCQSGGGRSSGGCGFDPVWPGHRWHPQTRSRKEAETLYTALAAEPAASQLHSGLASLRN